MRHVDLPLEVLTFDFELSSLVVAAHEAEHRPMIDRAWTKYAPAIRYWQVPDIDALAPQAALSRLESHVDELLDRIEAEHSRTGAA